MEELRFIADANVGKLARLLRMMGYDTAYFGDGSDSKMLEKARDEKRTVLTRDTNIPNRRLVTGGSVRAVLLQHDDPEKQLRQVISTLKLDYSHRPLSLCLQCNEPLIPVEPEAVKDIVPPYVFKKQKQFFRCPRCQRVYWGGSHKEAIEAKLRELKEEATE